MTSVNSVSGIPAKAVSGSLTWENSVSEGGLGPRSWWHITETVIYHQPKLTQPRACQAGISRGKGRGQCQSVAL